MKTAVNFHYVLCEMNSPTDNSPIKHSFSLKVKVGQQSDNLEIELNYLFMKYIPSSKFNIELVNNLTS